MYSPEDLHEIRFPDKATIADLADAVAEKSLVIVTLPTLLRLVGRKRWTATAEKLIHHGLDERHLVTRPRLNEGTPTYRMYDTDGLVAALIHAVTEPTAEGNALLSRVQLAAPAKEMVHDMDFAYRVTKDPRPNLRVAVQQFNEDNDEWMEMRKEYDGLVVHTPVYSEMLQYPAEPVLVDLEIEQLEMAARVHSLLRSWLPEDSEVGEGARDLAEVFTDLSLFGNVSLRRRRDPNEAIELRPSFSAGGKPAITFTATGEVLFDVTEADAHEYDVELVWRGVHQLALLGNADDGYKAQSLAERAFERWIGRQKAGERGYRNLSFTQYRTQLRRELRKM